MRSALLATVIGLVGAALIHIITILEMPRWTGTDAWSRVSALGVSNRFFPLANEPNTTGLYNDDPHIRTAVCHFDISDTPVRIAASGNVPLWTLSAYDTASNETYSMNDRSSIGDTVDLLFVTPAQMLQLRRVMPQDLERSVLVELASAQGFVALRAIAPTPSQEPAARAFVTAASCASYMINRI
jgi:uncharacterized membrane protein